MRRSSIAPLCVALAAALGLFAARPSLGAHAVIQGNSRPATPTIIEPAFDGRIVNGADVHMETAPFFDADGDGHLCSNWEIWTVSPSERVWRAGCATGPQRVHIHLGDGVFQGGHAGRGDLLPDTDYQLRVSHRDDSGDPDTEWSQVAFRSFRTASPSVIQPLVLTDVVGSPVWILGVNTPVTLPNPGGGTPARLVLENASGDLLLSVAGLDGSANAVVNPPAITQHGPLRVRIEGGSNGVSLPRTSIRVADEHCASHTVYLPAVTVGPGGQARYWVTIVGSTYAAQAGQSEPEFSSLTRGSARPFLATQPGYVIDRVASGFQLPVNIAFVPNPGPDPVDVLFYVAELYGNIKVVRRSGEVHTYASGLINFDPTGDFPGTGEQGLAGIVVDPTNNDLYASTLWELPGGDHIPRIVRLRSTDGGISASSITPILEFPDDPLAESHQISNISIGPDNLLYLHLGDGMLPETAQDLSTVRGKIIRFDRSGVPSSANPFYNAADGITARDYIYASGFRNPFGGAWRRSDGQHFLVDNGPSVDRLARLVRGRNYLWDGSNESIANFALYLWDPSHAPVNIAFVEPQVFGGSGFPQDAFGHAFVTESGPTYAGGSQELGKRIVEFVLGSGDSGAGGPTTLVEYAGAGRATCVAIAAGPDGLYFSDLYKDLDAATPIDAGANIWRVRYAPGSSCCRADYDGNGAVTPADVAAFVNDWFVSLSQGTLAGDFDGNGIVEPPDVAAFVLAWFQTLGNGGC